MLECKSDERAYDALCDSNAGDWQRQDLLMYFKLQKGLFKGCKQVCVMADPSTHSGDETLVGIVWSWVLARAAIGAIKLVPPTIFLDTDELHLAPQQRLLAQAGKLERKKAFRRLQAVISLQHDLTENTLEDYKVPEGVTLRPVRQGERREVEVSYKPDGSVQRVGYIVSETERIREIPEDGPADDEWPCLVQMLDKGSIGVAGSNFLELNNDEDARFLTMAQYDKIHALIRDDKNAVHRAKGDWDQVQVQSTYCWGLNYKPFNSGVWAKLKAELLSMFIARHDSESPIFTKHVDLIAQEWNMPYDGNEESRHAVFNCLSEMKSFSNKGSPIFVVQNFFCFFLFLSCLNQK